MLLIRQTKQTISCDEVPFQVPFRFVKMFIDILLPHLTFQYYICSLLLFFLNVGNEARLFLFPIPNFSSPSVSDYRPISIVSPFAKLFENILKTQMNEFISNINLISRPQYGFGKQVPYSTLCSFKSN